MKKSRLLSLFLALVLTTGLLTTFAAASSGSAILDEMDVNAKAAILMDPMKRTPTRRCTPPPSPRS